MANNKPFVVKSGLIPQTDNDQDLGGANNKFANAHISNLSGAVQINSAFTLPTADGSSGNVLQTDGAGNITWVDLAAVTFSDSAPTSPQSGDLWFDSGSSAELFIYTGTEWISTTGGDQAAFTIREYTGDGNTTVFNTGVGSNVRAFVYQNGVLLQETSDYSFSNGSVTFVVAPALDDVIQIMLHGAASFVDLATLGIPNHDTVIVDTSGNITVSGNIIPDTNSDGTTGYDLGSSSARFRDLYLSGQSINLDGALITSDGTTVTLPAGSSIGSLDLTQFLRNDTNNTYTGGVLDISNSSGTDSRILFSRSDRATATSAWIGIPTWNDDAFFIYGPDPAGTNKQAAKFESDQWTMYGSKVVIAGDLQVDGSTTTINSTTLTVDDLNITLASGAADAAAADGAGITVDGANANITYSGTNDAWSIDRNLGINYNNPQSNIHVLGTNAAPNVGMILQSHDTASATSTLSLYARDASNVNRDVSLQNNLGNLYINSNVGIGTDTPVNNLHIKKAGFTRSTVESTGDNQAGLQIVKSGGTFNANWEIYVPSNGTDLKFFQGGNHMSIASDTGNVGIGVDAFTRLTVGDTSSNQEVITILTSSTGEGQLRFADATSGAGTYDGRVEYDHVNRRLNLGAGGITPFTITSGGSVGIGTASPESGFKLDVIGDARFSDVAGGSGVELGWSAGGNQSFIQSYDRSTSAFKNITINNAIFVKSDGKIGVGISDPNASWSDGNGVQFNPVGEILAKKSNGISLYLNIDNASGNNRNIIGLYENSVARGYIGSGIGSEISVNAASGTQYVSLKVNGDEDGIQYSNSGSYHFGPWLAKNNTIDLGRSASKWKDLYLAGKASASEYALNAVDTDSIYGASQIFVYDTRLDSDGGAWRKRVQHTSWYNETLGTSTRGTRRDFPTVAVIVASSASVRIFDGDDPDLPLWMQFSSGGSTLLYNTVTGACMQNGELFISVNPSSGNGEYWDGGLKRIDFISERITTYSDARGYQQFGGIVLRNDTDGTNGMKRSYSLTQNNLGDQQMNLYNVSTKILPDAPVSEYTGLPTPTILASGWGGVSVIKPDGSIPILQHFISATYSFAKIGAYFTSDNYILTSFDHTNAARRVYVSPVPAVNTVINDGNSYPVNQTRGYGEFTNSNNQSGYNGALIGTEVSELIGMHDYKIAIGDDSVGLTIIKENPAPGVNNLIAHVTTEYNTGYMFGDTQLATLCDTDDTDIINGNVVTNGTFDADLNGWTDQSVGAGTISWENGTAKMTNANYPTDRGRIGQEINLVQGKRYTVSFEITSARGAYHQATGAFTQSANYNTGTYSYTVTAGGGVATLYFEPVGGSSTDFVNIDNVSVTLAEEDRSVNRKSLSVFGTIEKNPVSTGAELVGYSNFSSVNYVSQTYNSDIDFGTGNFMINVWAKINSSHTGFLFDRADIDTGGSRYALYVEAGLLKFYTYDGSATEINTYNHVNDNGRWMMITVLRKSGRLEMYIDGKLEETLDGAVRDVSNSTASLIIGQRYNLSGQFFSGSMALMRFSKSIPTSDQIYTIYKEEAPMFSTNAKCTIYGSSNSITGLAYDSISKELHVGTSGGRSVFNNLVRIDNTTTAVDNDISVVNRYVAED